MFLVQSPTSNMIVLKATSFHLLDPPILVFRLHPCLSSIHHPQLCHLFPSENRPLCWMTGHSSARPANSFGLPFVLRWFFWAGDICPMSTPPLIPCCYTKWASSGRIRINAGFGMNCWIAWVQNKGTDQWRHHAYQWQAGNPKRVNTSYFKIP